MSLSPPAIVERARLATGTRFRAQGRDIENGFDCVGLAMFAFAIPPESLPRNYRLHGHGRRELESAMSPYFRKVAASERRAGDLLLLAVRADQMHLAINCGRSIIHADARLRSVVERPGEPSWPIAGVFRRRVRQLTRR
jgi:cell wall-associated NlpC family hydrolase